MTPSSQAGDKITAYYCLLFPDFTYYLQTLNVSIGRRPASHPSSSSNESKDLVDIDLGPLSQVSRLHARIEYDEDQECFVLAVLGRNGAWVDGVWYASGRRVPLGARTQITIATQTFHFILPSIPESDESQSLSSPSTTRGRSPSVDILSVSPTTIARSPSPEISVDEVQPKPGKVNKPRLGQKRKKAGPSTRISAKTPPPAVVPPEEMPPKPSITYPYLSYRAIKAHGGRAALKEICKWISENYDWYRLNEGTGWEGSLRHTLSSHPAFIKVSRKATDKRKGFCWTINSEFEAMLEAQDPSAPLPSKPKDLIGKFKKEKEKALDPPFRRSVLGEPKTPLPPPLTNVPLPTPAATPVPTLAPNKTISHSSSGLPLQCQDTKLHQASSSSSAITHKPVAASASTQTGSSSNVANRPKPHLNHEIPASLVIPIVVKDLPRDHPAVLASPAPSGPAATLLPVQAIIHDKTANLLVLSPIVFGDLTKSQIVELEGLGTKKALEVLQVQYVRYLKEKLTAQALAGAGGSRKKSHKSKTKIKTSKDSDHPSAGLPSSGPPEIKVEPGRPPASLNEEPPMKKRRVEVIEVT